MNTVILTGAIVPSCPVRRNDSGERLMDYLCAIRCWLAEPSVGRLIYCDASGCRIPESIFQSDKFESLAFDASETARHHEKGRAELDSLEFVLKHGKSDVDFFFKCTGRLYVKNFSDLEHEIGNPCHEARLRRETTRAWADTRFFGMKRDYFFHRAVPYRSEITCQGGLSIEELFFKTMTDAPEFPEPYFVGYHALSNVLYDGDFDEKLKAEAQKDVQTLLSDILLGLQRTR